MVGISKGRARSRVTSVGLVVLPDPTEGFAYPAHIDRASLDALPRKPGVYLFRDAAGTPLYIGKSVDIRNRVLTHLRTAQEAALLAQSCRVDFHRTAGEIGALLMESFLIKTLQPEHNALLKSVRDTYSLRLGDDGFVAVVGEEEQAGCATVLPRRYGLYGSRSAAQDGFAALVREHKLCPALLGLETAVRGRACFAAQLGRCLGACAGRESRTAHAARLERVLAQLEDSVWPHEGPVGIVERCDDLRQVHIVDRWRYLGMLEGRQRILRQVPSRRLPADADTFRILARPMRQGLLQIEPYEISKQRIVPRRQAA
ncbi:MAG: endonuclease [Janthinobacterium lividum]